MYSMSPAEARAVWVDALRSGEYEQGDSALKQDDKFCCLGVACDLFLRHEGKGRWIDRADEEYDPTFFVFEADEDDHDVYYLPRAVQKWLGISSRQGKVLEKTHLPSKPHVRVDSLELMNDHGFSFDELADQIETNLKVDE